MNIRSLHKKIISSFEQKQANLRGLKGLKVKELKRVMKGRTASVQLSGSHEESKSNLTSSVNKESILDIKNTTMDNKVDIPRDEEGIKNFWNTQCQTLPENGKIGEYIHEDEQLLFEIDS